jgi:putative tryptophan/tyrosine transport system substrate-binding protein
LQHNPSDSDRGGCITASIARARPAYRSVIFCPSLQRARSSLGTGQMALGIGRRQFLSALSGAVATWPLAAHAQQPAVPVIGFLYARSPEDSSAQLAAFQKGLAEHGYVDGQNIKIEYRWARGQYDLMPSLAADLVRLPATLIMAGAEPSVLAAKAATATIPIVFVVGTDPVKLGIVASYNRPGGNATGLHIFTTTLEAKRLNLLHELIPRDALIGILQNPKNVSFAQDQLAQIQDAANGLGLRIEVLRASTPAEIDDAFATVARDHLVALSVTADPFFDTRRNQLVTLAAQHAVPVIYQFRQYAASGGLMSYGVNLPDAYQQAGVYVGRILKGEKPSELPVLEPDKLEFVINLKTAKTLGLEIPPNVLSIADEVIE